MFGSNRKRQRELEARRRQMLQREILATMLKNGRMRGRPSSRGSTPQIFNAEEFMKMRNENLRNRGIDPTDHAAVQEFVLEYFKSGTSMDRYKQEIAEISEGPYIIDEEPELT